MELNLQNLENHEYQRVNKDTYHFINEFGVKYEVYFADGKDYFPEMYFKHYLRVFGFRPISSTNLSFDKKIVQTIITILTDYLYQDDYIVMYVCDESDKKQSVRSRLFNLWFNKYNDDSFEKIDLVFEERTFVSAIISKTNTFYIDFKQNFPTLGDEYK
jgi:Family of unknown function (DUF6169)